MTTSGVIELVMGRYVESTVHLVCQSLCGVSVAVLCWGLFFCCSLHLTTMCLQYKPTVVACFCIHLACKWSNWEVSLLYIFEWLCETYFSYAVTKVNYPHHFIYCVQVFLPCCIRVDYSRFWGHIVFYLLYTFLTLSISFCYIFGISVNYVVHSLTTIILEMSVCNYYLFSSNCCLHDGSH
jgi:hypothetical protein